MIPRLTGFFEDKAQPAIEKSEIATKPKMIVPDKLPEDLGAASTIFISFTEDVGETFDLIDLHRKAKEVGLPHPHLSINRFRDAGILVSVGDGRFSWQPLSE